jgi:hypothetical protein
MINDTESKVMIYNNEARSKDASLVCILNMDSSLRTSGPPELVNRNSSKSTKANGTILRIVQWIQYAQVSRRDPKVDSVIDPSLGNETHQVRRQELVDRLGGGKFSTRYHDIDSTWIERISQNALAQKYFINGRWICGIEVLANRLEVWSQSRRRPLPKTRARASLVACKLVVYSWWCFGPQSGWRPGSFPQSFYFFA